MLKVVPTTDIRLTKLSSDTPITEETVGAETALVELLRFLTAHDDFLVVMHIEQSIIVQSSGVNWAKISISTGVKLPDPLHLAMDLFQDREHFAHLDTIHMRDILDEYQHKATNRMIDDLQVCAALIKIASYYFKGLRMSRIRKVMREIIVRNTQRMEGGAINQVAAMLILASEEEDPALAILTLLDAPIE